MREEEKKVIQFYGNLFAMIDEVLDICSTGTSFGPRQIYNTQLHIRLSSNKLKVSASGGLVGVTRGDHLRQRWSWMV